MLCINGVARMLRYTIKLNKQNKYVEQRQSFLVDNVIYDYRSINDNIK